MIKTSKDVSDEVIERIVLACRDCNQREVDVYFCKDCNINKEYQEWLKNDEENAKA